MDAVVQERAFVGGVSIRIGFVSHIFQRGYPLPSRYHYML